MIGIGKWQTYVNTMVFKGDVTVVIADKDGEYDIDFQLPDKFKDMKIRCYDIVENGNKLSGKGEISLLPGKVVEAEVAFEGDTMNGYIKLPFLAGRKIELKNGHRVEE